MKTTIKAVSVAAAVILSFTFVFAHPGNTDAYGGHWNHSTGEYHYHHGYGPHQHTGGVCPYDKTDSVSDSFLEKQSDDDYISNIVTQEDVEQVKILTGKEALDLFNSATKSKTTTQKLDYDGPNNILHPSIANDNSGELARERKENEELLKKIAEYGKDKPADSQSYKKLKEYLALQGEQSSLSAPQVNVKEPIVSTVAGFFGGVCLASIVFTIVSKKRKAPPLKGMEKREQELVEKITHPN